MPVNQSGSGSRLPHMLRLWCINRADQRWRKRRSLRCDGSLGSTWRPLVTQAHSCDSHVEDRLPTRGRILPRRAPHTWVSRNSLSTRTSPNKVCDTRWEKKEFVAFPLPLFHGSAWHFFFPVAVVADFWAVCVINHEDVSEWARELAWKISVCSKIMLGPTLAFFFAGTVRLITHAQQIYDKVINVEPSGGRQTDPWLLPSFRRLRATDYFMNHSTRAVCRAAHAILCQPSSFYYRN